MKNFCITLLFLFAISTLFAQDLKPTAHGWTEISHARKIGYVEGYAAGVGAHLFDTLCSGVLKQHDYTCILLKWRNNTHIDVDTTATLEAMDKLYADPRNTPVCWHSMVAIARAMVSGVEITDEDLAVVRQFDAKLN